MKRNLIQKSTRSRGVLDLMLFSSVNIALLVAIHNK